MHDDTIVALSSGSLPSGVAIVRVSGPASREALEMLAGSVPPERRASLRRIRNGAGETLDRGIVLFFPGPNSVTGEDLAEFHLHGGRAVVAAVLQALTAHEGIRLAQAGEFTRRAFESGRIDLTEAEGLADLIAAETEAQHRAALVEAGGALRALYEGWMRRLVRARAMIEASFDFADEGDVGEDPAAGARADLAALATEMRGHLADAKRGEILREGYRVAIVGAPNVGKSSLMNKLADRDVAIVTDIPGTTRDILEVTLDLSGFAVRVMDTAGLRETQNAVEQIGVERALAASREADLVLLLMDASVRRGAGAAVDLLFHVKQFGQASPVGLETTERSDAEHRTRRQLLVGTKIDLLKESPPYQIGQDAPYDLMISAQSGEGLDALVQRIADLAADAVGDPSAILPTRLRHSEIIGDALAILNRYLDTPHLPAEIGAETLRQTTDRLGSLTGQVGAEDLLDVIFSQFCIGK